MPAQEEQRLRHRHLVKRTFAIRELCGMIFRKHSGSLDIFEAFPSRMEKFRLNHKKNMGRVRDRLETVCPKLVLSLPVCVRTCVCACACACACAYVCGACFAHGYSYPHFCVETRGGNRLSCSSSALRYSLTESGTRMMTSRIQWSSYPHLAS